MSFYRSDQVNHYNLVIPRESAWDVMNKLGKSKLVHIVSNSSPVLTKPFFLQVKRCDENLTKLQSLEKVLKEKSSLEINTNFTDETYRELYEVWERQLSQQQRNHLSMLDTFEEKVTGEWKYYYELQNRVHHLKKKMDNYLQHLAILRGGERKFGRAFFTNSQFIHNISKVGYKTGILSIKDQMHFKRTIFRISRGNCLFQCIHFDDIFEKLSAEKQLKLVFFIVFPVQSQNNYLEKKMDKFINMYCQEKYELPKRLEKFDQFIKTCQQGYQETEKLLTLTENQIKEYFEQLATPAKQCRHFQVIQYIKSYIIKQREIYQKLNQFDQFNNFLKGEIYVRKQDVSALFQLLKVIQKNMKIPSGQIIECQTTKFPTNYITNDYTKSAKEIVQTYGVSRYREANPAYFTTITFPFLFGVMFGGIAHGALLLAFGLFICIKKDQLTHSMLKSLIPHRYLITLMGFFSFYCGWIYNDFMSVSLNVFGSCYQNPDDFEATHPIPRISTQCVYSFGIDPIWAVAQDQLNFVNSLKMKISVIIGVAHMILGLFIKATNSIYFRNYIEFVFQFVPQVTFMVVLFVYMDFLIIYKWCVSWTPETISNAPSIITTMVNIPLKLGKTDDCCGGIPLWGTPGHTSQDHVQFVLLMIAAVCVPLMLLPKPLYQIYCKSKAQPNSGQLGQLKEYKKLLSSDNLMQKQVEAEKQNEQNQSGEFFVHQLIQTIEYVLGTISNTASYLRLWALSLAHTELSQVFFEKTVQGSMASGYSGIGWSIVSFPVLAATTFGIVIGMGSMECFLHTLRLHWVEFQNKFYKGDGFAFVYFNFTDQIKKSIQDKQN